MELPPRIGPYHVISLLGRGGMATVLRVRHDGNGQVLALKLMEELKEPSNLELWRFRREFDILSSLRHRNVLQVHEFGVADNRPYFTMELIQGCTLDRWEPVRSRPGARLWGVSNDAVLNGMLQLLDGLSYIHEHGVIHRDIKPNNVLIPADGSPLRIMDFGLARPTDGDSRRTSAGTIVGTITYMAPEQISGRPFDSRADLYAVGAMLYEFATGRVPFQGDDIMGTITLALAEDPTPPRELNPELPEAFEALILKLLAKEPVDRYSSASEVREKLLEIGNQLGVLDLHPIASDTEEPAALVGRPSAHLLLPRVVGREDAWDGMTRLLDELGQGRSELLVILGEDGSGRSRMADELASEAHERHVRVYRARGQDGEVQPYGPIYRMVQELVRRGVAVDAESVVGAWLQRDLETESRNDRLRLFEGVSRLLRDAAPKGGIMILDDLQWADEDTLDLLQFLARDLASPEAISPRDADEPIVSMMWCCRLEAWQAGGPLDQLLNRLARDLTLRRVRLNPLDLADVESLAASMLGDPPFAATLAPFLYRESGGNPFLVCEALRGLADSGSIRRSRGRWEMVQPLEKIPLPGNLKDALERRLSGLSDTTRGLLELCAVIGDEFDYDVLRAASGRLFSDETELLAALDAAMRTRLLIEIGRARSGCIAFNQKHMRTVVQTRLTEVRRRHLHLQVAQALESFYNNGRSDLVDELAAHYIKAQEGSKALGFTLSAAEAAAEQGAFALAAREFDSALRLIETHAELQSHLTDSLRERVADVYSQAGRLVEAENLYRHVLDRASTAIQRASCQRRIGQLQLAQGRHDEALRYFIEALETLGMHTATSGAGLYLSAAGEFLKSLPAHFQEEPKAPCHAAPELLEEAAHVLSRITDTFYFVHLRHRDIFYAHNLLRAFNTARELGRPGPLAQAYASYAFIQTTTKHPSARDVERWANRVLAVLNEVTDPTVRVQVHSLLGYAWFQTDRLAIARDEMQNALREAEKHEDAQGIAQASMLLGLVAWWQGSVNELDHYGHLCRRKAEAIGNISLSLLGLGLTALADAMGGDFESARQALQQGMAHPSDMPRVVEPLFLQLCSAYVAYWSGQHGEAIEQFKAHRDAYREAGLDYVTLYRADIHRVLAMLACQDAGAMDQARRVAQDVRKAAPDLPIVQGLSTWLKARVRVAEGESMAALSAYVQACQELARSGARGLEGQCRIEYGRYMEKHGNEERGQEEVRLASAMLRDLGADGLIPLDKPPAVCDKS